MKFSGETKILLAAVNNVSLAISLRSDLAIMKGILFLLRGNDLILSGYDTDIAVRTVVNVEGETDGGIVIPARKIKDLLRTLTGDTVCFEMNANYIIKITSEETKSEITGYDETGYPEFPVVKNEESEFTVNSEELKNMINRTIFSVSKHEANPVFTGELFKMRDGILEISAVDGTRLSLNKRKTKHEHDFEFIVPGRSLNELIKIIGESTNIGVSSGKKENNEEKEDENVKIRFDSKHAIFNVGKYEFITRLLAGKFFDYTERIQRPGTTFTYADTQSLIETMEKMMVFSDEKSKSSVRLNIRDNELDFCYKGITEKIQDIVHAEKQGDDLEIEFNPRYILEALKACNHDRVMISFAGEISPIIIQPIEGDEFLYFILPIRIKK